MCVIVSLTAKSRLGSVHLVFKVPSDLLRDSRGSFYNRRARKPASNVLQVFTSYQNEIFILWVDFIAPETLLKSANLQQKILYIAIIQTLLAFTMTKRAPYFDKYECSSFASLNLKKEGENSLLEIFCFIHPIDKRTKQREWSFFYYFL